MVENGIDVATEANGGILFLKLKGRKKAQYAPALIVKKIKVSLPMEPTSSEVLGAIQTRTIQFAGTGRAEFASLY